MECVSAMGEQRNMVSIYGRLECFFRDCLSVAEFI